MKKLTLALETTSYNDRRYGRPWIAKLNFENSIKGEFDFKDWIGTEGDKGEFVVENCTAGDCFAIGQKDHRGNKSHLWFLVIDENGDIYRIDKVTARHVSKGKKSIEEAIEGKEKTELF